MEKLLENEEVIVEDFVGALCLNRQGKKWEFRKFLLKIVEKLIIELQA